MTTNFSDNYNFRVRSQKNYEIESSSDEINTSPKKSTAASIKPKRVKIEDKVKKELSEEDNINHKIIPPHNYKLVYETLKFYRQKNAAPVDSMGCSVNDNSEIQGKDHRFHVLLSLMLSSRTKDETTFQAMKNIKQAINGPFNINAVAKLSSEELHSCINKVGFHNQKLIHISKSIKICLNEYNGDIPDNLEGLISLPGVGPKMAYLVLEHAWNKTIGIGVDVHVHRICNRLNWVRTKTPEGTREALESWLPREYWSSINGILVGFGQTVCEGQRPKCSICPVQNYCPSKQPSKYGLKKEIKMEINENELGGGPRVKLEYEEIKMEN